MLDVELRKLRKGELLELLLEIEEENEQLAEENRRLKQQLEDKKVSLANVGSIAEASLQLSGVLQAAQEAADIYLYNVRDMASAQANASIERFSKTRELCLSFAREVEHLCNATLMDRPTGVAVAEGQKGNSAAIQALDVAAPEQASLPISLEDQVRALFDTHILSDGDPS